MSEAIADRRAAPVDLSLSVDARVLVLGAAPEAALAARTLAARGYAVAWVAGAAEEASPGVQAYPGYALRRLEGHVGSFVAHLEDAEGARASVTAAAIVVATGNRRALDTARYGLPASPAVLSVPQMRARLAEPLAQGARPVNAHRHQRVLFLLDYGAHTSRQTGAEALLVARDVHARWLCEVAVLYRELQVDSADWERRTREMRDAGIVFCRYDAARVTLEDEGVRVDYGEGALTGDLLVLPEDVAPAENTADLAKRLGVRVGADGFFQDVNIRQHRAGYSSRRGIYFAGSCHLDADPETLRADATQAAANVEALVGRGTLQPEGITAYVDSERCVRCLTCIRTCPHGAVALADYGQVTAARVEALACYGCGGCVANCPVRAITLTGASLPAWAADADGGQVAR